MHPRSRYMAVRPRPAQRARPDLSGVRAAQLAHVQRREPLGVDRHVQDAERLIGHRRLDEQRSGLASHAGVARCIGQLQRLGSGSQAKPWS